MKDRGQENVVRFIISSYELPNPTVGIYSTVISLNKRDHAFDPESRLRAKGIFLKKCRLQRTIELLIRGC